MNYVIIRDDDVNYFTDVNVIDAVYGELLEGNIPINFSVIPCVYDKTYTNYPNLYDAPQIEMYLQPEKKIQNKYYPIYDNKDIVSYLKNFIPSSEIIQHGYAHTMNEFRNYNPFKIFNLLKKGKDVIEKSFNISPHFFSAPYNSYSFVTILLAKKKYNGIFYDVFNKPNSINDKITLRKTFPITMLSDYYYAISNNYNYIESDGFIILSSDGVEIDPYNYVDNINNFITNYSKTRKKILVITSHYWSFYYLKMDAKITGVLNKDMLNSFLKLMHFLKDENVTFLNMTDFYRKIIG